MISVIVAAKNEQDEIYNTIGNIVTGAERAGLKEFEIIVVNDGSTDRTAEILKAAEAKHPYLRTITHVESKGVGASFLEGIDAAKYPKVTFFAGDNNAHADLAEQLFKNMDKADVIVSFFINTESRKRFRNVLSTIFSTIYITIFDLHVKYINGNSVYSVKDLKELNLSATSYSIFAEILVKLLRRGKSYHEVASYSNPDGNKSQALRIKTLLRVMSRFIGLIWTVYVSEKEKYGHRPQRIGVPPYVTYSLDEPKRVGSNGASNTSMSPRH
jgi:glycosyltransferase involved in cell wall biosynthesis